MKTTIIIDGKRQITIDGQPWKLKTYRGRMYMDGEEYKALIDDEAHEIRLASAYNDEHLELIGNAVASIVSESFQPAERRF